MQYETEYIYHICNQGNNRQHIFFRDGNYLFFIEKMREHLLPHCDILAWCLMPNHFHWMVRVNTLTIDVQDSDGVTSSHPVSEPNSGMALGTSYFPSYQSPIIKLLDLLILHSSYTDIIYLYRIVIYV